MGACTSVACACCDSHEVQQAKANQAERNVQISHMIDDGRSFWDEGKALLSHKLLIEKWTKEKKLNKYWRENSKHKDTTHLFQNPPNSVITIDKYGGEHVARYKHPNYNISRRAIQHDIIDIFVNTPHGNDGKNPSWIIFVGGALCTGKSFLVNHLMKHKLIPEISDTLCVINNHDLVRPLVPEWELYLDDADKNDLHNLLYTEVAYLYSCIMWRGLQKGKNVLVDGTMKNHSAYQRFMQIIKKNYADYKIGFIFVEPNEFNAEIMGKRLDERFDVTGRRTSVDVARESFIKSKRTYLQLVEEYDVDFAMRMINYGENRSINETEVHFDHLGKECKMSDLVEWKSKIENSEKSLLCEYGAENGSEIQMQIMEQMQTTTSTSTAAAEE